MIERAYQCLLLTLIAIVLGFIFTTGCASRPPLTGDSYPPQIAAQCERAKAQAIRQYGATPCP